MPRIDESTINFMVYSENNEFYGMANVDLPSISNMTAEIAGAGIAGTTESAIIGHIEAMSMTLNFRTLNDTVVKLFEQRDHQIELRVAQQGRDTVNGTVKVSKIKHVMTVRPKALNSGTVAPAAPADASGEYSVTYWATFIDGKKVLEIDQYNFIYFVNGTDYLAEVKKALGK